MSFSEKQIEVEFALASGEFEGGGNSATISGLRCQAQIESTYGPSQSQMALAIYGMPLAMMNQLATVGTQWSAMYLNGIKVSAGDDDGMSLVFTGLIYSAFVDANQMPEVAFRILASPGSYQNVKPVDPVSINGAANAADLLKQLAGQMGLDFQNQGVTAQLADPYYYGSAWSIAQEIADHAHISMTIDRGLMVITPANASRQDQAVAVGPTTGLVGYPSFAQNGVVLRTQFNPNILVNGLVDVSSSLTAARGKWKVYRIDSDLESITPGGSWFQTVYAISPDAP